MTRLKKSQLSKMSDELRSRTLQEFRDRIHRSVRNGEGHKTWFHLHLVFEFDRSLPAHRRLKVQEILALFPEPLRGQIREEIESALSAQDANEGGEQ